MDSMEQLQAVVGEVQAARQQVANLRAQVVELETTVDSVRNQPDHLALFNKWAVFWLKSRIGRPFWKNFNKLLLL